MKYIITESQYKLLVEDKEQKILELPGLEYFGNWDILQKFLEKRGNPLYSIDGDLNLGKSMIESLGKIYSVSGYLNLSNSLVENLGNLHYVKGNLDLHKSPISKMYSKEQIREMVNVVGDIFM